MTGRVLYKPPRKHSCSPGWTKTPQNHVVPVYDARPGTLWECDCGTVWVAWRCRRYGCLMVHWRREGWWERRRRLKNNSNTTG